MSSKGKQLPKLKIPSRSSIERNEKSFRLFNPNILSLDESKFQLDAAKDNLIHLQNALCLQSKHYETLSQRRSVIKSHLLGNTNAMKTVLSSTNNNQTDSNGENSPGGNMSNSHHHYNSDKDIKSVSLLSPILSPVRKTKRSNLLTSLDQSNIALESQIKIKEYELKSLRNTDRVSQYEILNSCWTNNNIQLPELQKNYDLLKLQYDELKLRLNKTIEQRNTFQLYASRYKLQCKQYSQVESRFLSPNSSEKSSPSHYTIQPKSSNHKEIMELKQVLAKLNKKIGELLQSSRLNENKSKDIQNQMVTLSQSTSKIMMTIDKIESELHQLSSLKTIHDANEVISILKSDLDISEQTLKELNENYDKTKHQINVYETAISKIECDSCTQRAQNNALMEIINEKERLNSLKEINIENSETIQQLQNELNELKGKGQTVFSQRL